MLRYPRCLSPLLPFSIVSGDPPSDELASSLKRPMMKVRAELPAPGAFNRLAAGSDEMRVLLPRFCFDRVIHPRRSDYCFGLEEGRQAESNGFINR